MPIVLIRKKGSCIGIPVLKDPKEVFKTVNRFLGIQITDGKRFRKLHRKSLFWIFNCPVPSVLEELVLVHCAFC